MAANHTNRLGTGAIQPIAKQEPSTALKPIEPNDLQEVMTFAQVAVRSGMFALKNIEEAAFRILYGRELGMSVFQSMMGIDIIQGRPGLKAGTVASLIKKTDRYDYRVDEWDHLKCKLTFLDNGKAVGVSVFTLDDAKRAGLVKEASNWTKYPKAMLFARALTQGARAYCPSVFLGPIHSTEELADGIDTIDVDIVATKPAEPATETAEPNAPFDDTGAVDDPQETAGEKSKKLDDWADRAAKRFEKKGFADYEKPGAVIQYCYERFAELGFVPLGMTTYRDRTKAISGMEITWSETLESLKTFVSELASELETPPNDDVPEPGSDG